MVLTARDLDGAQAPAQVEVWPFDGEAARRAGAVRRDLSGQGPDIGMADSLIAGICLERGAPLLTRNRSHFERVEGLGLVQAGA